MRTGRDVRAGGDGACNGRFEFGWMIHEGAKCAVGLVRQCVVVAAMSRF